MTDARRNSGFHFRTIDEVRIFCWFELVTLPMIRPLELSTGRAPVRPKVLQGDTESSNEFSTMPDPATILGLAYVGKKGADVAMEFVRDLLGPSIKAAGGGIAAPIEAWKQKRSDKAMQVVTGAAQVLDEAGLKASAVPGRVLWPLLEKSSVEEDPGLHQMWVRLLANAAAQQIEVFPAFVSMLSELSPYEARLLMRLRELDIIAETHEDEINAQREAGNYEQLEALRKEKESSRLMEHLDAPSHLGPTMAANLLRLGLIEMKHYNARPFGYSYLELTLFGHSFVQACQPPRSAADSL